MSETTHFRGILSPGPTAAPGNDGVLPPGQAPAPAALILRALSPLRDELGAALARGDRPAALGMSYAALSRVAEALAAHRGETLAGDRLRAGQVRVHALWVELETLPLEPLADGTLREGGVAVSVSYRNWALDCTAAVAWAQVLTSRFRALWPGAWVVATSAADLQH